MSTAGLPDAKLEDWKRVLGGRFEVRRSALIGRGAYAVVRRGRDLKTGKMVAVKFYADSGDDGTSGRPSEETLQTFHRGVEALQLLHRTTPEETLARLRQEEGQNEGQENTAAERESQNSAGITSGSIAFHTSRSFGPVPSGSVAFDKALLNMRLQPSELFVQLIGFSCMADGQPGLEEGLCYLVQDFGVENLDTHISDSQEFGKPMSVTQVCDILVQLTQAVAALHSFGLVHLDIKPANLMRFKRGKRSIWKLIDMDGLRSSRVSVNPLDIQFTPVYCSPELARAVAAQEPLVTVSRWMDIWSVGMSVLDCVLLHSLFSAQHQRQGQDAFLSWLGALEALDLPDEIMEFDSGLAVLLGSHVLQITPQQRMSVLELLSALHRGLLPFSPSEQETQASEQETQGAVSKHLPSTGPAGNMNDDNHLDLLIEAFKTWDLHSNGTIPQEMLLKLLRILNPDLTAHEILNMIGVAGVQQDGLINYRSFLQWMFAK